MLGDYSFTPKHNTPNKGKKPQGKAILKEFVPLSFVQLAYDNVLQKKDLNTGFQPHANVSTQIYTGTDTDKGYYTINCSPPFHSVLCTTILPLPPSSVLVELEEC